MRGRPAHEPASYRRFLAVVRCGGSTNASRRLRVAARRWSARHRRAETLAVDPLADLIGRFREEHPLADVRATGPEHENAVTRMVPTGEHEPGLAESTDGLEGLDHLPLTEQQFFTVLPPGAPQTGQEAVNVSTLAEAWRRSGAPPGMPGAVAGTTPPVQECRGSGRRARSVGSDSKAAGSRAGLR